MTIDGTRDMPQDLDSLNGKTSYHEISPCSEAALLATWSHRSEIWQAPRKHPSRDTSEIVKQVGRFKSVFLDFRFGVKKSNGLMMIMMMMMMFYVLHFRFTEYYVSKYFSWETQPAIYAQLHWLTSNVYSLTSLSSCKMSIYLSK